MNIKYQGIVKNLLAISFFVYLFQAVFFVLQINFNGHVFLGPKELKVFLFLLLFVAFILLLTFCYKHSTSYYLGILLYCIFLALSLASIVFYDMGDNQFNAFLYNYSLSIVLIPLSILYLSQTHRVPSYDVGWLGAGLLFTIALIALIEWIYNLNAFSFYYAELNPNQYVKFDHINGDVRLNSIFRSPIDYSYLNAIFGGVCLILYLISRKKVYGALFFLMTVISVLIKVRSGIVFMAVSYIVIFSYFLSWKMVFKILVPFLVLLLIFMPFLDLQTILDPTNLFIRLENWMGLLSKLDDPLKILLGIGVVQNGSFGEYHSVIIDNLYIGILMTGGLISLGIFLFIIFFIFYAVRKVEHNQKIWIISSLLGMLAAGFFENVMHLLYLGFIPVFFKISKLTTVR